MVERVPKHIMEGRSSLGKQLTKDRYYQRAKKSVFVAYIAFFLAGSLGAHRFYLGRWKSGLAFFVIVWALLLTSMSPTGSSGIAVLVPLIFLIELTLVYFLTKWTNEKLKCDFDQEMF